jgi:hypothetical protein
MSIYPSMLESIIGPELNSIVTEMEECFPPVTPNPHDSIAKIMYQSGQRSAVEWLLNRINNLNNEEI